MILRSGCTPTLDDADDAVLLPVGDQTEVEVDPDEENDRFASPTFGTAGREPTAGRVVPSLTLKISKWTHRSIDQVMK